MTRLLALLLFANVALFGYLTLVAPTGPVSVARPPARRLELVGERVVVAPSCQSAGPFKDADTAHAVVEWLTAAKRAPKQRTLEVDGPSGYWVVAKRKSTALAVRTVQQLRAAGVTDIEIVPPAATPGEVQVSLGLYTDPARADKRVAELKRFALDLVVIEQKHRVTQWWVDVESPAGAPALDLAALVRDVPAALGATLGNCPLSLPPDPEAAPASKEPSPAAEPAKLPGAPA